MNAMRRAKLMAPRDAKPPGCIPGITPRSLAAASRRFHLHSPTG